MKFRLLGIHSFLLIAAALASDTVQSQDDADELRQIEHARVSALVDADMETAQQLHADDFQLVNPAGIVWSKEQYLGGIASGAFDYRVWEPHDIEVRMYGDAAVIRYQSDLEIVVGALEIPLTQYWHTDLYERRDGRWQAVWSQATEITAE